MNIVKRSLNVVTLFAVFLILAGIYMQFFESRDSSEAFSIGGVLLGFVLIFNYILFQNVSVWNRVNKT
jgi:uncharacterized membrane protein YjfL (UPF0719 family)